MYKRQILSFRWGVAGAAGATVLAQLVSTIGCFIYAFVRYPVLRLHREDWRITMMDVKRHLTRGIPLGLQFSVLAVGIIVMQGGVVQFDMRDGVMVSNAAQNGFGAANRLFNLVATRKAARLVVKALKAGKTSVDLTGEAKEPENGGQA